MAKKDKELEEMVSSPTSAKEMLDEKDKHTLNLTKLHRQLAVSQAEKTLAQSEVIELSYRNLILQLTMKYSLTADDVITEDGEIKRNVSKGTK